MMIRALSISLASALALGSTVAGAAVRHVATSGSDDGNDCSVAASPCASIGRAIAVSTSGDSIRIASGSFHESNMLVNFGSITLSGGWDGSFASQTGGTTTIDGAGQRPLGFRFENAGSATVALSGLTLTGGSAGAQDVAGGLLVAAISSSSVTLAVDNVVFEKNRAERGGGAWLSSSGSGASLQATITGSRFVKNRADECGGLYLQFSSAMSVTVSDTTFEKNKAKALGGGLCAYNLGAATPPSLLVERSRFVKNRTADLGGGVMLFAITSGFDAEVRNSVFLKNAASEGGAIGALALASDGIDGSLDARSTNNTMSGNRADAGGAFALLAWDNNQSGAAAATLTSTNDIARGNKTSDAYAQAHDLSSATIDRRDGIHGPSETDGASAVVSDVGVLDVNPELVRAGKDFHLQPTSPAIDAVSCVNAPADDFEGDPRPAGAQCDMGADEAQ